MPPFSRRRKRETDKTKEAPKKAKTDTADFDTNTVTPATCSEKASVPSRTTYGGLWAKSLGQLLAGTSEERAVGNRLSNFVSETASTSGVASITGDDLISELQAEAKQRQDEADAKAWKVRVGSRIWVLRDVAGKIVVWLNRFKEVGDVAVSFDPTHAALPWAAFRFVLQIRYKTQSFKAMRTSNRLQAATIQSQHAAELLVGLEKIASICLRCRIYERLYLNNDQREVSKALESAITALFVQVLEFPSLAVQVIKSNQSLRNTVVGILQPERFASRLTALEAREKDVEIAANNCHRQLGGDTYRKIDTIHGDLISLLNQGFNRVDDKITSLWTTLDDDERYYMLRWISDIPYQSDFENIRSSRLEGTCEWLIAHEKYIEWRDSNSSTTLRLHEIRNGRCLSKGGRHLRTGLGCLFFCDRSREDRRDPLSVLCSLVRQLSFSRNSAKVMPCTAAKYLGKKQDGFASSHLAMDECRALLVELANIYPQTTIVIDGLDECDPKSRHALMEALAYIVTKSSGLVKVFIASRNDDDIKDQYEGGENLNIQASHNQSDIDKYVANKMKQTKWCRERISQEIKSQVLKTFQVKSQGMFQWAALHINDLLELKSDSLVADYLHALPEGLTETYAQIYNSIDKRKRHIADRAFQGMISSWRPLSAEDLEIAVCQDPDAPFCEKVDIDIDFVLETCRNLIVVIPESSKDGGTRRMLCKFAHLSVQEYLEINHWSPEAANNLILRTHMRYLRGNYETKIQVPRFWNNRMSHWDRQSAAFDGKCCPKTLDLILGFLGSPKESSLAFRAWASELRDPTDMGNFESDVHHPTTLIDAMHSIDTEESVPSDVSARTRPSAKGRFQYPSAEYNSTDGITWKTTWISCVTLGLHDVMREWLQAGLLDPDSRDSNSNTALGITLAMMAGHYHICKVLLDFGANPNLNTGHFATPLQAAAVNAKDGLLIAQLLLENGAKPNIKGGYFGTPLHVAAGGGDEPLVRLLLQNGADINGVAGQYGTPLQAAATYTHRRICEILLDSGADVNLPGGTHNTPLVAAVSLCDLPLVALLLSQGANANSSNDEGTTALHEAPIWGKKMIEMLIQHGADVNAVSSRYGTPLQAALMLRQPSPKVVKALLRAGALYDEDALNGRNLGSKVRIVLGLQPGEHDSGSEADSVISSVTYLPFYREKDW
ncbi:hypothetical protein BJ170DRAFT_458596 [Xylariales sp. AK1849]|nr:hypothetical protein BJ170DRAFT_458596 [Xylariales sp. AK1849]